jgi:hypothetical protein
VATARAEPVFAMAVTGRPTIKKKKGTQKSERKKKISTTKPIENMKKRPTTRHGVLNEQN